MSTIRTLAAGLAALPLTLAPALAQEAGAWSEVEDEAQTVESYALSVDELEDLDIYGADGEQIGEVEEVLAGADGLPAAIAMETEGFLGTDLGGDDVVVPFDQLQLEGDRLVTALAEDDIEALETWDD